MLKTGEASKLLGISAVTLREWARRNALPYLRTPSGQLRFPKEYILKLADSMSVGDACDWTPEELLTPQEVSDLLGISTSCVRNWDSKGLLQHAVLTPTGRRLYKKSDVSAVLSRMGGMDTSAEDFSREQAGKEA